MVIIVRPWEQAKKDGAVYFKKVHFMIHWLYLKNKKKKLTPAMMDCNTKMDR